MTWIIKNEESISMSKLIEDQAFIHGWMDGWMASRMGGWMDGLMDRWMCT